MKKPCWLIGRVVQNGNLEARRQGTEEGRAEMAIHERRLGMALVTRSFLGPNSCWRTPPTEARTIGGTSSSTAVGDLKYGQGHIRVRVRAYLLT